MEAVNYVPLIIILIICSGIFMVCRELICWYFKLSDLSAKMDDVNKNLAAIRAALEPLR